ncbi:hypothetical protein [Agrococcus sp. SGAir0287]|uniref:hypothetical protein n=1 Tax=Agrococcus sp. SGAir0287 TaxID=2070347 RepID=UPI0010F5FE67|nr:hypothetical protein [Agrococcus sp. SGAir0287]
MRSVTGAPMFGEDWPLEGDEAVLFLLVSSTGRRDIRGIDALAEALGRTVDAVDWRLDTIASQLDAHRGPKEEPLPVSAQLNALLREYERHPVRVTERAKISYERLIAGERPASLRVERQRADQQARTCPECFQERALDGSCGC